MRCFSRHRPRICRVGGCHSGERDPACFSSGGGDKRGCKCRGRSRASWGQAVSAAAGAAAASADTNGQSPIAYYTDMLFRTQTPPAQGTWAKLVPRWAGFLPDRR